MQMLKAQAVGSFTDDDIGNSANDGYNYQAYSPRSITDATQFIYNNYSLVSDEKSEV